GWHHWSNHWRRHCRARMKTTAETTALWGRVLDPRAGRVARRGGRMRHPFQVGKDQGRPAQHHSAGYCHRGAAGAPQAAFGDAIIAGAGRLAPDDLLFGNLEGGPPRPSAVSSDWDDVAERLGMPEVTFHGLRHTHASQLIAGNVDIVTISKRLGHAKPSVTLAIYAHMFHTDDSKAAVAINAALG